MTKAGVPSVHNKEQAQAAEARRAHYNRTVREANLRAILLSSLKFDVRRSVTGSEKRTPAYRGRLAKFAFDEEKGAAFALVEWEVVIRVGRRVLAKCTAQYDVLYDGFTVKDAEIVQLFAENVARPATYSYFRALYANLDWAAELRAPPLPVVKFYPKV